MNYNSTLREVYTLAHELGHAIHSLYANKHFPSSQHANLPLSETASTFGEMILFEKLFANEKDVKIKKSMLWEKMSDAYATILRQNYFVLFEIKAHEIVGKGATMEELNKLYLSNLREQFGNSVKVEGVFQYEWMYISHIFESPFYCYAYNFGELLSLALWSRYKAEGAGFIPKLEKILETGGSQDPTQILSEVGVDVTSAEFWMGGFDIISGWQKQLEEL
jgi:oligoendopeptidase F